MNLNLMKRREQMYDLKRKTSPIMNEILLLHSEWLESDGQHEKAKECREQAAERGENYER